VYTARINYIESDGFVIMLKIPIKQETHNGAENGSVIVVLKV
jgi:hypothetical protein